MTLRIALVILHADPTRGGAERYTHDLALALRGRGHHVTLIASSFAPNDAPDPPARDDESNCVRLENAAPTRAGRYLRFLDELDRHLIANDYDIVHAMLPVRQCDVYHPHAGVAAESILNGHLKYEGPVMRLIARTANRMNTRRQRFAAIERALLERADGPVVLCLSDYVKSESSRHYALPDTKIASLFNATDLTRFDPAARPQAGAALRRKLNLRDDQIVALIIAQDFYRKGVAEAIRAVARVKDERLVLLVVGKPDATPYRQLAQREGAAHRVIFAGPTDDPYSFYRAADFFVLPTRHDPCSLVVLEALAMGVPVISTQFNGACQIMEDVRHGFVLPDPADVAALAASMHRLLDPVLRQEMSAHCLALRPRLSYQRHLDDLLTIYQRITARAQR